MISTRTVLLTIVVWILNYHVHSTGKKFYSDRTALGKTNPKLYDVGFKYLPDLSHSTFWNSVSNLIPTAISLFLFFSNDIDPLAKALSYFITVHAIRMVFMSSTILPKVKTCDDSKYTVWNIFNGHCYDKIFSGHIASTTILFLVLHEYKHVTSVVASLCVAIIGMITVATRNHYTVDVLMGILVALGVYKTCFRMELQS
jgi:hypothetical protein